MICLPPVRNVYEHRKSFRVLLFAAIAIVTAWSAFTSYSASPDDPGVTINPQPEVSLVKLSRVEDDAHAAIDKTYGSLPLSFEVNRGQADASVKYVARGPGYNIFLKAAEAVFVLKEGATGASQRDAGDPEDRIGPHSRRGQAQSGRREAADNAKADPTVLSVRLKGANTNAGAVEGTDQLPGKVNYFIGNDSSKWLTDIPTYRKVVYRDAYPGIDMVYYGNRQQLEYDFVVAPGADAGVVALSYEGAQDISVDREGNLVLKTKAGQLRQLKPVIYQEIDGERKVIEGRYQIRGKNSVGFRVPRYDQSKPLVIDPILVYSSLVNAGGSGSAIAVDNNGFAYITGYAFEDFNPTDGAFQSLFSGDYCTFVTKLNQSGTNVVYSTYIGGNAGAESFGIAVDNAGSAYITGYASGTFPTTIGAFQTTHGSDFDCFVTKLNATGNALVYSTFYGGAEYDEGIAITVDAAGNAYVTGDTVSRNLVTTVGALQTTNGGGADGFVFRLNPTGTGLGYSTYLGGGGSEIPIDISVDSANNIYVAGETSSFNYPQVNALQGPAGLNRGLFKSTNNGGTWTLSNSGLLTSQITAIAINSTTTAIVYAATIGGVSKSTNGGATWVSTGPVSNGVRSLAIDPSNPSTVYAGTGNGVYKTTNGGDSWTAMNNGIAFQIGNANYPVAIRTLAIDPGNPATIYAGGSFGFYKSTNGGASWTRLGTTGNGLTSESPQVVVFDPVTSSTIYVGFDTRGFFKSTDSGVTWNQMVNGLAVGPARSIRSLAIVPNTPATIYAGTTGGIFKTTDGGNNWSAVNTGLLVPFTDSVGRLPTSVNAIVVDPNTPTTVYAGATSNAFTSGAYPLTSIFKSTDGGANWVAITNGFGSLNNGVLALAINRSDSSILYVGTTGDFDGFASKISASGASFNYSTFVSSNRNDYSVEIVPDSAGNSYLFGFTGGSNFPLTAGAFDSSISGAGDTFAMKLNASGTARLYSTLLGGNDSEDAFGMAVDPAGNAYLAGWTRSPNFPVTPGAFQTTLNDPGLRGTGDAFVTKLNATGTALVYSSFLGGSGDEMFDFEGNNLALDPLGNAYVVGQTGDTNTFPAFNFANAFSGQFGPSSTFVAKIESNTPSFSITGRLTTAANVPIGGVIVQAFNGGFNRSTVTDADGYYSIVSLPAGDYQVAPSRAGTNGHFVYAPTSRTFVGLSSNQTANFTGTQVFDITGRVTSQTVPGLGIFDVTMTLTGSSNAVVTTDADGNYAFRDLVPGGNYTVTPSKTGFAFSPINTPFTNLSADMTANFETASGTFFFISGHINDAASAAIPNVLVTMTVASQNGSRVQTTQTNASGEYVFENLQAGGNYRITPSKTKYSFGPASLSFNNLSANQLTANFQGTELVTISGRVFNRAPDASLLPVPGVQVAVTGSAPITTDANGQYSINVPKGGNYVVAPIQTTAEPNYRYIPANLTFNNLTTDQLADFERLPFYRVSGRIADTKGVGIANVMLVLGVQVDPPPTGPLTTMTDSNGYYRFDFGNSSASTFFNNGIAVYPSKPGYSFAPILYRTVAGVDIPGIRIPGVVHSNEPFAVVANFTPTHSISGRVTDSNGPVNAVTLTLSGGTAAVVTSDANGNYSFLNVADGNDYTVTPSKTNLVFLPSNRTFVNFSANQTGADFSAQVFHAGFQPAALTGNQVELKTWTVGGRTYAYVKLLFPNAGFRVANWGTTVRTGNDFTADAAIESATGASVQAVTSTAQIYDLGPLTNGSYNFNFKTSGVPAATLAFTITSAVPPPNPIDDARTFVKWQYRAFLNREPDQAGEDFWTDNITKCMDPARRPPNQTVEQCTTRQRETTSGAFFQSPEFQYTGYFVYRMYQGTLGRQPKLSEFTPDALFVGNGIIVGGQLSGAVINQNKAAFAAQFVNCVDPTKYRCAEFKATYDGLTNQQFVDKLFQTTGVNASAADRAALVNGLNANPATETRASVVQKVVDGINVISEGNQQFTTTYGQAFYNAEFNRAFVQLEYFGYMKRDPDEAGYAFWLAKLNQFGGDFVAAEMVLAFISSPEYRARFGQP